MLNREDMKELEGLILDLVKKVRLYHEKYGQEYLGGKPFHFILADLKKLGINV